MKSILWEQYIGHLMGISWNMVIEYGIWGENLSPWKVALTPPMFCSASTMKPLPWPLRRRHAWPASPGLCHLSSREGHRFHRLASLRITINMIIMITVVYHNYYIHVITILIFEDLLTAWYINMMTINESNSLCGYMMTSNLYIRSWITWLYGKYGIRLLIWWTIFNLIFKIWVVFT